jgi:hypothetical protein
VAQDKTNFHLYKQPSKRRKSKTKSQATNLKGQRPGGSVWDKQKRARIEDRQMKNSPGRRSAETAAAGPNENGAEKNGVPADRTTGLQENPAMRKSNPGQANSRPSWSELCQNPKQADGPLAQRKSEQKTGGKLQQHDPIRRTGNEATRPKT